MTSKGGKMKNGTIVWLFVKGKKGRELDYGRYIRQEEGQCVIAVGKKIYKRKITEIAEINENDKNKFIGT